MASKKKKAPKQQAAAAAPPAESADQGFPALLLLSAIALASLGTLLTWFILHRSPVEPPPPPAGVPLQGVRPIALIDDKTLYASYAGSESCRACHKNAYDIWSKSNHGLAERAPDAAIDDPAFVPSRSVKHGTQTTDIRKADGRFEVAAPGLDGNRGPYPVQRVIGHTPLRQFLVSAGQGRLQTLEASYDPIKNEWFNVYGDEDRKPGEWGHWTGRGMNWNNMCASCHNTRVRKNYDIATDAYSTKMVELTVGCESCHGPMKAHVDWQEQYKGQKKKDTTIQRQTSDQWLHTCGSCHARRGDRTGEFTPGDSFYDHYSLTIPDSTDLFYPDGQIREEDYEFTSFLSSRMHASNVRCVNCHNPHSGKTIFVGNDLCMGCHNASFPKSPKIDPATHTFHKSDSTGAQCVNCHMPQTVYMQRHRRHDHGFTIPDPLLTKQYAIPNACNRCHKDKDADWALQACDKWYGERMNRPTRIRAQWIAQARRGEAQAREALLKILADEPIPFWQAVAANLLGRSEYLLSPGVADALVRGCGHADPLVRENAVRALEPMLGRAEGSRAHTAIHALLQDDARSVRVAAASALRGEIEPASVAGKDLLASLAFNSDQPAGAMNFAQWYMTRRDITTAAKWFEKAAAWDAHSAAPRDSLAVAYSMLGRTQDALAQMQQAVKLEPNEPEFVYRLALAYNEAGDIPKAAETLEQVVKLSPRHGRAWYNLGLAYSAGGSTGKALDALDRAEKLDATDPNIPYAAATILARLGKRDQAKAAALRALRIDPGYRAAEELLQSL